LSTRSAFFDNGRIECAKFSDDSNLDFVLAAGWRHRANLNTGCFEAFADHPSYDRGPRSIRVNTERPGQQVQL
jgi:hypothetical protein